ncbi:MAG: tRNA (guanosine(46)-N7)-methyltransferase TrmB [Woeseiaceae bacterium]|nr:tRNA (guanosine(46)-N7)-methyltransferase TrmB [Woeseiaceae bacterium]
MTQDGQGFKRTVRSFVRRTGRITESQQRALDELWPLWGVEYSDATLDPEQLFGRSAPLTVEIGFGNGDSLVQLAAEHPEHDFLGIEVHVPGIGHCLIAARQAGIDNLRIISHDAVDVLSRQVAPGSVSRLNLYFPDPWPKKRHHKRRILNVEFLNAVHTCLKAGGTFHIATDWQNYAEYIDELFAESELFRLDERREHDGDEPLDRAATKFEKRGLRRGHRIWDWRFEKIG